MNASATLLERLIAARARRAEPIVETVPETEAEAVKLTPLELADPPPEPEAGPAIANGQCRKRRKAVTGPQSTPAVETAAKLDSDSKSSALAPLAVDAKQLGKLIGLSTRSVRALDAAGKLPHPIRLGHAVRWVLDGRDGIRAWLAAGAPERRVWEAMREARR